MHVLVFPGWYPGKADNLSGDFIQRHLEAISLYCKVTAIVPVKDISVKNTLSSTTVNGNLTELYISYPSVSRIKVVDKMVSFLRYNYLCIKSARAVIKKDPVNIVHLYVLQKNHLTGLLLQLIYRIPFVVSEQSTLYIDGGFEKLGRLRKSLWSYVFKRAASYHSVSHYLANNIKNKLQLAKEGVIIPNVVDSGLFFYNHEWVNSRTTFVHVSNMVYQKNVEGMLQAFAKLKKNTPDFILNLVGPMPLLITELIAELGLEKQVVCWGERNYKEVAGIMQQSDVFVFFTRFETFGCVIIEANASGLPVIVSDLPVTREVVKSNVNGLFVESENEQDLAEKLLFMKHHLHSFDPLSISLQTRNKYNYNNVGKQFSKWYTDVLAAEK